LSGTLPCIGPGSTPASDHQPPDRSDDEHIAADVSYPLMGLPTILPITHKRPAEAAPPRRVFVIAKG
jgi:hypothetical protein